MIPSVPFATAWRTRLGTHDPCIPPALVRARDARGWLAVWAYGYINEEGEPMVAVNAKAGRWVVSVAILATKWTAKSQEEQ